MDRLSSRPFEVKTKFSLCKTIVQKFYGKVHEQCRLQDADSIRRSVSIRGASAETLGWLAITQGAMAQLENTRDRTILEAQVYDFQ